LDDVGADGVFELLDEHVRQAMQISEKISTINHQQHMLQQAFDRLSDAIFFLGQGSTILIANCAAYEMTKADDGLRALDGALTGTQRTTADKLRALVNRVAGNTPSDVRRYDALAIPKPSGGRALHLLAMPAIASMEENFASFLSGKPSAFVMVSDPDRQPALPEERLQAIFGLTPAEAKLASALVSGTSVSDYASEAGVTENTARWTLKQVQAKTDCRRQADLVRLLAATCRVS
jgi:DNA-binding CsgD family transcriptional regulator